MAEEIEFDAVNVVVAADLLDVAEGQIANLRPRIIDGTPPAVRRPLDVIADEPVRVLGLERREEEVRLVGPVLSVVRVVHAHRPEHLHLVLVAEVDDGLQAVGPLVNQFLGDVACVRLEPELVPGARQHRADFGVVRKVAESGTGGAERDRVDVRAGQRRGAFGQETLRPWPFRSPGSTARRTHRCS